VALKSHALTIANAVQIELDLPQGPSDYFDGLVNFYSEAIEKYCNRHFEYNAAVTENLDASGARYLVLSRTPVASITSVSFDGAALDATGYELHDAEAGTVYLKMARWSTVQTENASLEPVPGEERALWTVVYAGGYTLPKDSYPNYTLPSDLERACVLACVAAYRNRNVDPRITSEELLSYSVSYADTKEGFPSLPKDSIDLLSRYVRPVFA